MEESVEDRCGDDRIAEDIAPAGQALVRRQNDRAALVATGDQLKEQVRARWTEGQIADLIDDEELRLSKNLQLLFESVLALRSRERSDQCGRGSEQRAVSGSTRFHAD